MQNNCLLELGLDVLVSFLLQSYSADQKRASSARPPAVFFHISYLVAVGCRSLGLPPLKWARCGRFAFVTWCWCLPSFLPQSNTTIFNLWRCILVRKSLEPFCFARAFDVGVAFRAEQNTIYNVFLISKTHYARRLRDHSWRPNASRTICLSKFRCKDQ